MSDGGLVRVPVADDLSSRTDSGGKGVQRTGIVQLRKITVLVDESVSSEGAVDPYSNNNSGIIDAVELRAYRALEWNIDRGEDFLLQQKAVFVSVAVKISSNNVSRIIDSAGKAELRAQQARWVERDMVLVVQ